MHGPVTAAPIHDPLQGKISYLLRRASALMMAELAQGLAAHGLTPVEATLLVMIGANPGCTQSELGRVLFIKRANMAPLVASLIRKDLLQKSPVDGRSIALSLTPLGIAQQRRAMEVVDLHEQRVASLLDEGSAVAVSRALRLILDRAVEDPD